MVNVSVADNRYRPTIDVPLVKKRLCLGPSPEFSRPFAPGFVTHAPGSGNSFATRLTSEQSHGSSGATFSLQRCCNPVFGDREH
jgi:hypothetical protein